MATSLSMPPPYVLACSSVSYLVFIPHMPYAITRFLKQ
ncbi:MAG: hypothetical protein BSOLF_0733 [Candidatus Carbobacillus altaicus]|uniref:Uncharacterized protein n=1 Tax=Candidatus Carbonibacillus altaicus TaxID=2163959 RepID=A0A2R6Y0F0_9BACL|nr:MAG: hypothetical protein BSOLF_0733 [Candidatus Carbobacillus altaicus]